MPIALINLETTNGTGTSGSITINLTAGNGVVICMLFDASAATVNGISQTAGDTVGDEQSLNDSNTYQLFACAKNVVGGSTTFSFNFGASVAWRFFAAHLGRTATAGSLIDQSSASTQTLGTTHPSGATNALAQGNDLAIACFLAASSSSPTTLLSATNGFTLPANGDQLAAAVPRACLVYCHCPLAGASVSTIITTGSILATGLIVAYRGRTVRLGVTCT